MHGQFILGPMMPTRATARAPVRAAAQPPKARYVIGATEDLQTPGVLREGEEVLPFHLGATERETFVTNQSVLRRVMREGRPIRDVSPRRNDKPFLNAERTTLEERGWSNDDGDYWTPPEGK